MAFAVAAGKRPNRSAADRRQQQLRAQARASAHILRSMQALQHRGSTVAAPLTKSEHALKATVTFESDPLEVRISALESRLTSVADSISMVSQQIFSLEGKIGALTAMTPATASGQYSLDSLVDPATLERIDRLFDEQQTASQDSIWWKCPEPNCSFSVGASDRLRSQKKAQHKRRHSTRDSTATTTEAPTAHNKPFRRIRGKTSTSDVDFGPLREDGYTAGDVDDIAAQETQSSPKQTAPSIVATSSEQFVLNLRVQGDSHDRKFPIAYSRSAPLQSFFDRVYVLTNQTAEQVHFFALDQPIDGSDTPANLGLEDGMTITAVLRDSSSHEEI